MIGDGDELTQVFLNLVDNAIKYGDAEGTVSVAVRRAADTPRRPAGGRANDGAVVVSVADRGAGIPREHLPRLTERFYRVDKARSRELGGTGLGLAIVKHIVNRHRGALAIDSTPGEGSTFTVYLQPAAVVAEDAPGAIRHSRQPRVNEDRSRTNRPRRSPSQNRNETDLSLNRPVRNV